MRFGNRRIYRALSASSSIFVVEYYEQPL